MGKKKDKTKAPSPGVRCPLCDGQGKTVSKSKVPLAECEGCGLLFLGSPPSRQALAQKRESRFKKAWVLDNGGDARKGGEKANEIMRGYFLHAQGLPVIRNAFDRNVLDVDCGLGFRLRRFQEYGWAPYGMDASLSAVEFATASFLDASLGWFDEGSLPERRFDLVFFEGSFCCLPDPVEAVRRLEKVLRPKGFAFVRIPKAPCEGQLFYFDLESLRRLFMENGFAAVAEEQEDDGFSIWFTRKRDAREPVLSASAEAGKEA